jgi:uncharacterized protein involved in exopolysaccharide biosynthesis
MVVLVTTVLVGAAATVAAFIVPRSYRAVAILSPVTPNTSESMNSSLGQISGLAAVAGLTLGSAGSRAQESIATLASRELTERFVEEDKLLPILFANRWDAERRVWKVSQERQPTLWDANELFRKKIRSLDFDRSTGLVTLTIDWRDAQLAARWANELVARTNELQRARAIEHAERNIRYLKTQQEQVSQIEVRQAVARLLENEIKTVMLAQGTDEYAFKVIDHAEPPKKPDWPPRTFFILGGVVCGLLVGVLITVARGWTRELGGRATA